MLRRGIRRRRRRMTRIAVVLLAMPDHVFRGDCHSLPCMTVPGAIDGGARSLARWKVPPPQHHSERAPRDSDHETRPKSAKSCRRQAERIPPGYNTVLYSSQLLVPARSSRRRCEGETFDFAKS